MRPERRKCLSEWLSVPAVVKYSSIISIFGKAFSLKLAITISDLQKFCHVLNPEIPAFLK